ncbi:FAD-dependent oxidoreductase [Rhodococcus sp. NPDC058521]|uniref:FAD-dependent oxidoreductase n=1 Tax=Rhodococcus sp. NPDC058521 TaxID=3346536 RepID=UPI0036600EE4
MTATDRPLRVAVVGGGPAGLYTADALTFSSDADVQVDILERLPVPFGLLRYGVAPDHPNIKLAAASLQATLDRPNVRLFCNVEIGRDIDVAELREHYDSVVYATGADTDKTLGVDGEHLPGSTSATEFVKWYNGHPEAPRFDLSTTRSVAVIGAGNVALDVTRLLVKSVDDLRHTDIGSDTMGCFASSTVTDVHVLIRRGAEFTKFTTKELRELGELAGVDVLVDPSQLPCDGTEGLTTVAKRNLAVLRGWSERPAGHAPRRVHFHFSARPTAVLGVDAVRAVRVEGDDGGEEVAVDMVLRAVGYRSRPIAGVPFDAHTHTIPHHAHRVVRDGVPRPGEYAVGWVKRGPTGILGTNRSDAEDTATALLEDRQSLSAPSEPSRPFRDLLAERGIEFLDNAAWDAIAAREDALGAEEGRARVKIREWAELVAAGRHTVDAV